MDLLEKYGLNGRFENEAGMYPELSLARVTAQYRGMYKIVTAEEELQAELSGRLRHETAELAMFPTVGDYVMVSPEGAGSAVIHRVLTRKSLFLRTAVGVSGQAQSVAANIDTVFICMSLNNNFNLSRLERYLSVAWDSGATPVILLTKADLCQELEARVAEAERVSAFADLVALSVYDDDPAEKLAKYLRPGMTAAFIGSSGVGKSTLINRLLGEALLATGETGFDDKGRHTTTGREMFPCPSGGVLIDTPGMRELGVESADLEKTFEDIEALAAQCRYSDCGHSGEPGCAVLAAVEDGRLERRRLDSYLKLRTEAGYDGLNSREIEAKKFERMFKDVGGMKNARRFASDKRRDR